MVHFSKIFGLAGTALVFAGMAYGQVSCTGGTAQAGFIRAEGQTELLPAVTYSCTGGLGSPFNVTTYLSPALVVTSKVTNTSSGTTEAVALINPGGAVYGTVVNNAVSFTGLTATGSFTLTIANIRVNATAVAVGSGIPPAITEQSFVSGAGASASVLSAVTVAYVQNGLNASSVSGAGSFPVCAPIVAQSGSPTAPSAAFSIKVSEGFAGAFKTAAGETGVYEPSTIVTSGTRIQIAFTNVPSALSIFVPTSVIASDGSVLTLTASATGAYSATPGVTGNSGISSLSPSGLVAVTSGSGTVVYEVTTANTVGAIDSFSIPVYVTAKANSVAASTTALGVAVSFAPLGALGTNIPSFVAGANTTTLSGSVFNGCTTSLLFPFVTNQLGFDTGLAIANTSTDPFGSAGAFAQAGTCTIYFYGAGAPTPNSVATPNIPSGTVWTGVVSGLGAGFQGYLIAQCSFQYAHGFAFITDGVGANGGLSQGYLAGVIPDTTQVSRSTANPIGSITTKGYGETLGN
jgi:hypothetical protein